MTLLLRNCLFSVVQVIAISTLIACLDCSACEIIDLHVFLVAVVVPKLTMTIASISMISIMALRCFQPGDGMMIGKFRNRFR